jgi:hypothetical protein
VTNDQNERTASPPDAEEFTTAAAEKRYRPPQLVPLGELELVRGGPRGDWRDRNSRGRFMYA